MRLVTRSDFDSVVSAALLKELGIIDEIFLTHPKDLQDNKIVVTKNDVLVNVPYVEGCGLWFDHHSSEEERLKARNAIFKVLQDAQLELQRMQTEIIVAEAKGNWLQRSWRPIPHNPRCNRRPAGRHQRRSRRSQRRQMSRRPPRMLKRQPPGWPPKY